MRRQTLPRGLAKVLRYTGPENLNSIVEGPESRRQQSQVLFSGVEHQKT